MDCIKRLEGVVKKLPLPGVKMPLLSTVDVVSLRNRDPVNFGNFFEYPLKQFRCDARSQLGDKDQGATVVRRNLRTIQMVIS